MLLKLGWDKIQITPFIGQFIMPIFQISHGESIMGAKDHLLNTIIFTIRIECCKPIITCLGKGYLVDDIPKEEMNQITIKPKPYTLHGGQLWVAF
jgi:hypothetical protein